MLLFLTLTCMRVVWFGRFDILVPCFSGGFLRVFSISGDDIFVAYSFSFLYKITLAC